MRRNNVALRLQTSHLEEAQRVAESEGVALNQLINVAVAEIGKAKRVLKKAGAVIHPSRARNSEDDIHRLTRGFLRDALIF